MVVSATCSIDVRTELSYKSSLSLGFPDFFSCYGALGEVVGVGKLNLVLFVALTASASITDGDTIV